MPIPLTVEELNSNRESRSGPKYQVPSPKCTKYEVPIQKYQEPSQNYQEPSQKYRETISKYQERSPRYKESSDQYQDPKQNTKYQVPSPKTPKSSKKNGVHWAKMPEESAFVDEDCSREFDELYYSSVVTSHKKTDRGVTKVLRKVWRNISKMLLAEYGMHGNLSPTLSTRRPSSLFQISR